MSRLYLRLPLRGGSWNNGSTAGVSALNLNNPRSNVNHNVGFRAALPLARRYAYTYTYPVQRLKGFISLSVKYNGKKIELPWKQLVNKIVEGCYTVAKYERQKDKRVTMKTIKNLYSKIYDFENLYQAWESARKGKRFRSEVMEFTDELETNLINIQNYLIYGTYRVGKYRQFYVYEPKKRLIMALPFCDRVVQWAIYRQLFPIYDKQFIFDSYACRKGKGTHAAADRLQYWLRQTERKLDRYYYLKLDVSKYFYRIDHAVLIRILKKKIRDKQLIKLLSVIINCEDTKFGLPAGIDPDMCPEEERLSDVGIPIGNLTSQMFANIYLNELDQYAKHELKLHYYIRYMDDVVVLHKDKNYLSKVKQEIESFLNNELHLQLNNKTAIRPCSMGIDFVGFRIWATHRKLKKKTSKKIKARVKYLIKSRERGETSKESFKRSIASYKGILKHCNSYGFRKSLNKLFKNKRG